MCDEIVGTVFNIERYHIHDGIGIRTAVFLKGCNLVCPWCCNPESQSPEKQLVIFENLCKKCRVCEKVCPNKAIHYLADEILSDESLCEFCGKCTEMCPYSARKIYGVEMSVDQIMDQVLKDAPYYSRSGGGITITGGEPTMQSEFVHKLLEACNKEYIHSAVETCGIAEWKQVWKTLELADEILLDIKTVDPEKATFFTKTGDGNATLSLLMDNIEKLIQHGKNIVFRCPIIPGFNFNMQHIDEVIKLAYRFGIKRIDILPYHELGKHKYTALKRKYPYDRYRMLHDSQVLGLQSAILAHGFACEIGG